MISKKTYGVVPTLQITVGNTPFDPNAVGRVELVMEENKHDMLVMDLAGIPPEAITTLYSKPVEVYIDVGGNFTHRFTGYVEEVRPESFTGFGLLNKSPFQSVKVICMGASYAMRGSRSDAWNNYRLSDIARELSARYGFSLDVPSDRIANESLVQANESDWQFLTRYAKFLGYSVNVHGTHMHIYDPYKAKSRQNSYHVLNTVSRTRGDVTPSPGQVIEFNGNFSRRHVDGEYKEHYVTIINPDNTTYDIRSTTMDLNSNGEAKYQSRVTEYVDNYEEAARRISAIGKEDYDFYATATVIGLAGCVPGGIIKLDSYGGDFDTFWYVQGVKHVIHSDAFTTELDLAVNTNSELKFTNTQRYTAPPKSVYRQGAWVAESRLVNEYS